MRRSILLLIFSLFSGCLSSTETKPIVYSVSLGRPATLKCEQEDGKWSLTQNDTTTEVEGISVKRQRGKDVNNESMLFHS